MRKAPGATAVTIALIAALILAFTGFGYEAACSAATLTGVRLSPQGDVSELALSLDAKAAYSVARDARGGVAVRLPGVQAAAGVKTGGLADARVGGVSVGKGEGGVVIHVRSRAGASLGYMHFRTAAGVNLRLFADAPGGEPASREQASSERDSRVAAADGDKAKEPGRKPPKAKKPVPDKQVTKKLAKKPVDKQLAAKGAAPKAVAKMAAAKMAAAKMAAAKTAASKTAAAQPPENPLLARHPAGPEATPAGPSPSRVKMGGGTMGGIIPENPEPAAALPRPPAKAPQTPALPNQKFKTESLSGALPVPAAKVERSRPVAQAEATPPMSLPAEAPKLEMVELPESGPDIGGLLPGTQSHRDDLLRRLSSSRDSDAAYAAAVRRFLSRDYAEALKLFRSVEADYPGSVAAARSAYRAADCLYGLAGDNKNKPSEDAVQAYLRAVNKWPLKDEVGRAYLQIGRLYVYGNYDYEALGYLGLAIKNQPDGVYALNAYISRGDLYFKRGQYPEAQAEYQQVGRLFPNSAKVREANYKLIRALFAQRDFAGVESAFQQMRQRWPETFAADPQLLRYIGETYFQQGDYGRSREFLFYVLNIFPDAATNHLVLCKVGDCYLAEGKQSEAAKLYRLVITTFPDTDGARLARLRLAESGVAEGHALVDGLASGDARLGDIKLYEELAAGKGPMAQRAKVRIGLWHYWRRDYLKAAEQLRQVMTKETLPPDLSDTCRYAVAESLYRQAKVYYSQGRFSDAVKLYGYWGKWFEGGQRAEAFYYLAESFRRVHLPEDALKLFVKAQPGPWREDRRMETLYGLGLVRLETGDYALAAKTLKEAVDTYPDHPWRSAALSALGKAHYLSGRYEDAGVALEAALRYRAEPPTRARDFYMLGLALVSLKDYARAASAFQESLASSAVSSSDTGLRGVASLELGNALYQQQRWEEAARAYAQAARFSPRGPEAQQALYKAGKCYLAMGRRKEAAQVLSQGAAGDSGVWKKASAQMLDQLQSGTLP